MWVAVALALVAAAFSRFALVLAIPVFAWLVLRERPAGERTRAAIGFGAVLALGAALWIAYNQARWGVWYDIGYSAWYHQDGAGSPEGSPFQLRYFPYHQFWSFSSSSRSFNGPGRSWCRDTTVSR